MERTNREKAGGKSKVSKEENSYVRRSTWAVRGERWEGVEVEERLRVGACGKRAS